MSQVLPHISVCICTYKRPAFLKRLLDGLDAQDTENLFAYSVVVADNDRLESGRETVARFQAASKIPVTYCVQPEQNIALTRNKAVENAAGDWVAFIDDDEFPTQNWLLTLFKASQQYGSAGAIGPVKRHFDEKPPEWVRKGNFYERATYKTGLVIDWSMGRTNNVLVKRSIIPENELPFRPEFRSGEDQDFFRRMIQMGHFFVWCNEAIVYEVVPPARWKRTFMLRRALLQGTVSVLHPTFGASEVVKSLIAIPVYIVFLPFALLTAHHKFMSLMIRLCDHVGKLLALMKINAVREPYVTE